MPDVVKLKVGHAPPKGDYLLITQVGRNRGFDYYVEASPTAFERLGVGGHVAGPGFASLESALQEARRLAAAHGLNPIYVEASAVLVRPFQPGEAPIS